MNSDSHEMDNWSTATKNKLLLRKIKELENADI